MRKQLYVYFGLFCFLSVLLVKPAPAQESDILQVRGVTVTKGAAPGYIEDRVCAMCHSQKYRSYQEVGMAQSFYRPKAERFIENFKENHFFHELSKRHYEMIRRDDQLFFKRYQRDEKGNPINVFEIKIDWIMGSGNHSRVYLYQTEAGELYQLPVAWYTQTQSWGMAPGFDWPTHLGVTRVVRRECMFCHNAYPNVPVGNDAFEAPHVYPKQLPEGTGCQRCHGPGANHVRTVFSGELDTKKIRAAIINPKRLTPQLRDDICFECHMQPSVVIFGVRRFDRPVYSFRPGQRLSDYLVQVDVKEEGKEKIERFEINHHPYRLLQSPCFKESKGALNCLICHDPHRKVPKEKRAEHYRTACLTCHKADSCHLKSHSGDCAYCHMPERRTHDVIQVVMTDHLIQRKPEEKKVRLAPLKETVPIIVDVQFMEPGQAPQGDLGEVYRAVSVMRAGGSINAVDRLAAMLPKANPPELVPYLDLAKGQMQYKRFAEAERTLKTILARAPELDLAEAWLGISLIGLNRKIEATGAIRRALKKMKTSAEAEFNLGWLFLEVGAAREAAVHIERAIQLRPNLVTAWLYLGHAQSKLNQPQKAIKSYKRTLEIDPTHTRAYLALGRVLLKTGNRTEAFRYWRHGVKVAAKPEPIAKALAKYSTSKTQ